MKTMGARSLSRVLKDLFYVGFGLGILLLVVRFGNYGLAFVHADNLEKFHSTSFYHLPLEEMERTRWRSENQRVGLELHRLYGELRHLNLPRGVIAFLLAGELLLFFCFFTAMLHLAHLFEDLSRGEPFAASSARHLKWTGIAVTAAAILAPVWEVLPVLLFRSDLAVPGTTIPWLAFFWIKFNPGLLLAGLLLLVVAEAFRIGHRMEREQRLTI